MTISPRSDRPLDLICVGRIQVDLYGEQFGGSLEDMRSFVKLLGGAPANIAVGASRLGLNVGMISRVGDEQMGRFCLDGLEREGIDTSHILRDPERLTSLALLGVKDSETFPLLYYRENCADAALSVSDIDGDYIGSARAVVVTGTLCANPVTESACHEVVRQARERDVDVILDLDFRPVLWGLTGQDVGESRFVSSRRVTDALQRLAPSCDLILGTLEEFHIGGGTEDTLAAASELRSMTDATMVMKLGPEGCAVIDGPAPRRWEDLAITPGFPVEVVNVLGAGDAFLAGLLRGRLKGEDWRRSCRYANACGAIVVTRNSCAPATPSWRELSAFLDAAPGKTAEIAESVAFQRLHRNTTGRRSAETLALVETDRGVAAPALAETLADFGMTISGTALPAGIWGVGSRQPWKALRNQDGDLPAFAHEVVERLRQLPAGLNVIAAPAGADDDEIRALVEIQRGCMLSERDFLVDITGVGPDSAPVLNALLAHGVTPDWWILPSGEAASAPPMIAKADPACFGVVSDRTNPQEFARLRESCRAHSLQAAPFVRPNAS
ncbi:5-dehydro-2-deoxygluconokinase [Pikeienuella piscinae]|uniref:5-dehydro-2-deoxygluconokinase n=1 Tax=Pikeienuella piscinae TaxID=2748098 RepID=A0A7L5BV85_9RHOB|nr:5-dehydro-2-deoxygluconokinase [Pikeienuella piscinae]QIE54983.1 5-dehydro-2-deoxygluconokinase [Pikeienuella piscinae]